MDWLGLSMDGSPGGVRYKLGIGIEHFTVLTSSSQQSRGQPHTPEVLVLVLAFLFLCGSSDAVERPQICEAGE